MLKNVSVEKQVFIMLLYEQSAVFVQMLMRHYGIDERAAIDEYYHSETYRLLSNERTKLWWLSVYAIFEVYKTEKETGSAMNSPYVLPRYE